MLLKLVPMRTYIYLILHIFRLLLDLLSTRCLSDRQKDLKILMLRHQLRIVQRKLHSSKSPRISLWEKGILAVLAVQFRSLSKGTRKQLDEAILLFKPDTVLRWHRCQGRVVKGSSAKLMICSVSVEHP